MNFVNTCNCSKIQITYLAMAYLLTSLIYQLPNYLPLFKAHLHNPADGGMPYNTTHKNRTNPIFVVRHLVPDPTNSLISVGWCTYPIMVCLHEQCFSECWMRQPHPKIGIILFLCGVGCGCRIRHSEKHCSCKQTFR
jgi:hypothetical protein